MLGTAGAAPIIFPVAEIRARVVVADDDVLLREGSGQPPDRIRVRRGRALR
jgi:hypothetical protein